MNSKLSLIVFTILLAILLAGCSKQSFTNTNIGSNSANSNSTATTSENTNVEQRADDSSTNTGDETRNTDKPPRQEKATNNAPATKRSNDNEPPIKTAEKQIRKRGDRILRDSGQVIKEGERRVRGILNGTP